MTTITLPPRLGGRPGPVLPPGTRCLTVIGANGAGKSRFAKRLRADLGPEAWAISALNALYGRAPLDKTPGPVSQAYAERTATAPMMRTDLASEFDQMLALLLDQEMVSLLSQKYDPSGGATRWEPTRLEEMARLWHDIFPDNRMLLQKGTVLFANNSSADTVGAGRLSDGEKAIIYYLGSALMAPSQTVLIVDSPSMFLHPSMTAKVWDKVEELRGRSRTVYVTHDLDFAETRASAPGSLIVWVRRYDADRDEWDYEVLPPGKGITDEMHLSLMGSRKPVMFIEGDGVNSIDAKLYPLVFRDFTVRSLGGCDKVIEATRTFNDLNALHNLDSVGVVDRDRRNEQEVEYLRRRRILVPDVAEIENLLMLPDVVRAVAAHYNRDADKALQRVKRNILQMFAADLDEQALQHTRHRVKVTVEHTIDRRFTDITQLERHMTALVREIRPRQVYEEAHRRFETMVANGDYEGVLLVYNNKSMITLSKVASHCGVKGDKDGYIAAVLSILRHGGRSADAITRAIRRAFRIDGGECAAASGAIDETDAFGEPDPEMLTYTHKQQQRRDHHHRPSRAAADKGRKSRRQKRNRGQMD